MVKNKINEMNILRKLKNRLDLVGKRGCKIVCFIFNNESITLFIIIYILLNFIIYNNTI